MGRKSKNMSLSLTPDLQDKLDLYAKQKTDGNVSKLVRDIVEKYLVVYEDDVIPVILKIPVDLKGDPERLEKWLQARSSGIVKALSTC